MIPAGGGGGAVGAATAQAEEPLTKQVLVTLLDLRTEFLRSQIEWHANQIRDDVAKEMAQLTRRVDSVNIRFDAMQQKRSGDSWLL